METYYRKKVEVDERSPLKFQILDWVPADENFDEDEPDEYVIRAFGADADGNSVCCTVRNFKPYFYIQVPAFWSMAHFKAHISKLQSTKTNGKNLINYYIKNTLILKDCLVENWIPYYGFCNEEKKRFVKMVFTSHKGMKGYLYAMKALGKENKLYMPVYDSNMDPMLKFFHLNSIQPSNHVSVSKFYVDESSRCQINIECDYTKILPSLENYNNPFLQASYDIETYSKPQQKDGKEFYPFPVPELDTNTIYQIATCFKRVNSDDFLVKHLVTLKNISPITEPNIVVHSCETEKELLLKWIEIICGMDPDIIYSYNGNMFDDNYVSVRCNILGISRELGKLSRLVDYQAKIKEAVFSSSAYGKSEYKRLDIPGVINFDILIFVKREFKEKSYKLDNISEKYLGEKKNPVSVVDIFKAYETGDPDDIRRIGNYCIQDTRLPQLLVDTLHILQTQISMSNVTYVTIKMLIERGQEIKALSQINMISKRKGFLMPHCEYTEGQIAFEGATVLPIDNPGLYNVVTTVDFEGLYPSIIRAHGLCATSIVLDPNYLNLSGVEYFTVKFSDTEEATFAKNTKTVIPDLLLELYNERKKYKKLMKLAETPLLKEIYNRTQLAVKVSANSIYGILGSKTFGCRPIAASVTYFGRTMIKQTKDYIETNHHSVYPENCDSYILDEDKHVIIKGDDGVERLIKVSQLVNLEEKISIKTDAGWREFFSVEEIVHD
jgi:DNA polymerase delta subunit 1